MSTEVSNTNENGNCVNRVLAAVKVYKWEQWDKPKRFLYKGFGLIIWKWCGIYFPLFTIYIKKWHLGYDIFHNGHGIIIDFHPLIILNICIKGKIGWWYKKGIFRIRINRLEWQY